MYLNKPCERIERVTFRQASAPPPQFQDEPPTYEYDCSYKTPLKCLNAGRKDCSAAREYPR